MLKLGTNKIKLKTEFVVGRINVLHLFFRTWKMY